MKYMIKNYLQSYNVLNDDILNLKTSHFWYKFWLITRICNISWSWNNWHIDKHDELNTCHVLILKSHTDSASKIRNLMSWHNKFKICLQTFLTNKLQINYELLLQIIKCAFTSYISYKFHHLLDQIHEWLYNFQEVLDKSLIEIHKFKKWLYIMHIL